MSHVQAATGTNAMSERGIIYAEKPQQCDLCGKIAELRPYGPNGECVCYECGMLDKAAAKRGLCKLLFGEEKEGGVR